MKRITITGHLARDPMVSRYCGMAFAMFRLVPDESSLTAAKRQDDMQRIREFYVFAFDKEAEYVERYVRKKSSVRIVADLEEIDVGGENRGECANITAAEIRLLGVNDVVPAAPLKNVHPQKPEAHDRNADGERQMKVKESDAYVSMDGFFDNL